MAQRLLTAALIGLAAGGNGPGSLVFDNSNYPACCETPMPGVCMYRIPVVLHVPETQVVMAFAEARLGAAFEPKVGCSDGAGPAVPMRRSTDGGESWAPMRWIANDTQPEHIAKNDYIVMGMAVHDPTSKTSFLFYTACYQKCVYTTTYVLRSKDDGVSWSEPSTGNLTDMLLEGDDGISMMQFGEGQGLVMPSGGELLVCGWYKLKGRPPGEQDKTDSIACLSSADSGDTWKIKGRLPTPTPQPFNEVTIGLMKNHSIFMSMRTNPKVNRRYQARSDDGGATFTVAAPGELPAPRCNAGTINLGDDTLVLAHIEPNKAVRANMTIRGSNTDGKTWPYSKLIWPHPAGYVTLTTTEEANMVAVLYENGDYNTSCYSRINYQKVAVSPMKTDDSQAACAALVARLGCEEWSVAELCPRYCATTEPEQNTAATSELPMLFMAASDIRDTWGHQVLVAPPVLDITSQLCNSSHPCDLSHPRLVGTIQGGLMAPSPMHPEAGYELFYFNSTVIGSTVIDAASGCAYPACRHLTAIYLVTTTDFMTYSEPIRVGTLNNMTGIPGVPPTLRHRNITGCIPKSMTRSDAGDRYVVMTICSDAGLRPMVATTMAEGFSAQRLEPSFWDHDDNNLGYSGGMFVDLQITFENQTTPGSKPGSGLKYCDNVGLTRCAQGFRRIVTYRTSVDGLTWSDDAACPGQPWNPEFKQQPFNAQFHFCNAGWNVDGMIIPIDPPIDPPSGLASTVNEATTSDPPEMEFCPKIMNFVLKTRNCVSKTRNCALTMTNFADKLVPMFVGSTKRIVGHALTYAPSPQASIGKDYGMRPSSCAGSKVTHPDLRACHGPHIGVERMIGPDDGNLTSTPMMKAWRRPFRESVGNRQGITPVGELLTEGGMLFRGYHVWLGTAMNGAGGTGAFLGLPAYRLAGFYSLANSEFSTASFKMPSPPLHVNADVHWTWPPHAPLDKDGRPLTCDEGCAAYLMVALHDAATGKVVAGYEKEQLVFTDVDGTRLPLDWKGKTGSELAGKTVYLRIFYRDATVFAVGHGGDADAGFM